MLVYQDKYKVFKNGNRHNKIRKDDIVLLELNKGIYNSKVKVHYLELGDSINATKEDFIKIELVIGR